MIGRLHLSSIPALLVALVAARAAAEPAELERGTAASEGPWSQGVPEESRRAADELFRAGNVLLRESISVSAAARYREALRRWDHPNIHYNLALALMTLDQPLETHAHLVAAMRYGPEPLQHDRFEHARNYLALLEKQLARVTVRCDVAGARVALDGEDLFTPPGEHEALVRAGRHTLTASKDGLVTNQTARMLVGGQRAVVDLKLRTFEEMTTYRRRWSAWIPWSVVGSGLAVALAGAGLQYGGLQRIDRVDRQSRLLCPAGCASEPPGLASERARGVTLQRAGIAGYAVGGAALAGGALLVYLNRTERHVQPYESGEAEEAPRAAAIEVSPVLEGDRRGLAATLRY
jgi:hypothetical protein